MYLTTTFLPLISAICVGFSGRWIGKYGAAWISTYSMYITLLLSFQMYFVFVDIGIVSIEIGTWIVLGTLELHWEFLYDGIVVMMFITVNAVSLAVHLFSISYMATDPHYPRFTSYLSLFTFFMLLLVTSDNFLQLFLGWEGVGLCSYLLIGFWYTRLQANKSAIKAVLVNKIGDWGLFLAMLFFFYFFSSLQFDLIFILTPILVHSFPTYAFGLNPIEFILSFLLIGSIGKSAQIGLHIWLPDAMEGPTPVSALIHAATMVTAGVFLIVRLSPLFEYASTVTFWLSIFGACTALFAATSGMVQNDIKKVIAYSTCSQLGFMIFSSGLGAYGLAQSHLCNHAFFKALLFLSSGAVIHSLSNEQDIRYMGGLAKLLPISYVTFMIGNFSLMGLPPLSGFYSKDVIIEFAFFEHTVINKFSFFIACITTYLTAFYSIRLFVLVFLKKTNANKPMIKKLHESDFIAASALFFLSFFSLFFGWGFKDIFGMGSQFFSGSIYNQPESSLYESEFVPPFIKLIPTAFSVIGGVCAYLIYYCYNYKLTCFLLRKYPYRTYVFLYNKWFFDSVYSRVLLYPLFKASYIVFFKFLDKGALERLGPTGLDKSIKLISKYFKIQQSGSILHYMSISFFSFVVLFFIFFLPFFLSF